MNSIEKNLFDYTDKDTNRVADAQEAINRAGTEIILFDQLDQDTKDTIFSIFQAKHNEPFLYHQELQTKIGELSEKHKGMNLAGWIDLLEKITLENDKKVAVDV